MFSVSSVSKSYGKNKVLTDVSLSVSPGECIALLGINGSGKSTLLHILGGVDVPSAGKVYIDNVDVYAQDETNLAIFRRRQIGLIYQFYNLIPVLNVEENITLPLLLDGRKVDPKHLQNLIATLGLEKRLGHLPNQLSGGQQQRVSIGRALANSPALVLADEPTGNLDSKTSMDVIALLKLTGKEFAQTIVMITNNEEIATMADQMIRIEDGRIFSAGVPDGANGGEKDA